MDIDRLVVGEGTVNHYWTLCFANEDLRQRLGLKYISQMWDQTPYWYLWFVDFPGAFKLSLLECVAEPPWDWRALFRIKYYPRPEERIFQGLSVLEQICRMSELFHTRPAQWAGGETGCVCHGGIHHHHGVRFADLQEETGIPNATRATEIPEDFFLAGEMELRYGETQGTEVSWTSQEYWRIKMTENYFIKDQEGAALKVLRKGDVDRDYPGWLLTDFVANRFSLGWQAYKQYPQLRETTEEQDGIEFLCDGHTLSPQLCPSIRRKQICRRMNH